MSALKGVFESIGHTDVKTYINSGNVIFTSTVLNTKKLQATLEKAIEQAFGFFVDVLVVDKATFISVIEKAPKEFGKQPDLYHSDVIFLLGVEPQEAVMEFEVNPSVDAVWAGKTVVYFHRLSEKRTKSKLSKVIAKPIYKKMTIRNWNTTQKLANMLEATE